MPSSFTPSLRLTLPVTGENSGTWGDLVNTGITDLVDSSIAGYAAITMTDANYTLTSVNGAADDARKMMLNMSGTLSAPRNVICPTASKLYFIKNATAGGFAITLKTSAGSGISVPNGRSMVLMCDGVNVREAVDYFGTLNTGALRLSGATSGYVEFAAAAVAGTTTYTLPTADGTSGQVLQTNGSAVLSWATAAVTPGSGNVGYLNIPQNSQSAAYTLVLADSGKHILHPSADTTARTFTIPANGSVAFPIGTAITFVNQNGAGTITIDITTDTMRLAGTGATGSRTLTANGTATALKITATEWIISGVNLS
jgi:hypothetical protein